jgi:hypothetical protein
MNCERVQLLLGLDSELDPPTRRALAAHVGGCPRCAEARAAEVEFRRLMAARTVPGFDRDRRLALLSIPPPGLTALRLRLLAGQAAPIAVAAGFLVAGTMLLGRDPRPQVEHFDTRPNLEAPAATVVAREAPAPSLQTRGGPVLASEPSSPAQVQAPAASALPPAQPVESVALAEVQPAAGIAVPPPVIQDAGGQQEPAPPPSGNEESGQSEAPATPLPAPTSEPLTLRITAISDLAGGSTGCPGCDMVQDPQDAAAAALRPIRGVEVAVQSLDDSGAVVASTVVILDAPEGEPYHAEADVEVPVATHYRIALVGAGDFILCPTQTPERLLEAPTGPDALLFVRYVLGAGCPTGVSAP